jgi:hypothetical protein
LLALRISRPATLSSNKPFPQPGQILCQFRLALQRNKSGPRRRLAHKISLHKAASEVRYIVNFNNGSTTGSNGVSEFILTAHMAPVASGY